MLDGVGLIVGIDRFMSEARAVTNFAGNAVATVIIGTWVGEFDKETALRTFRGENPFNEATLVDDHGPAEVVKTPTDSARERPETITV